MDLEDMLSEISQTEKDEYYMTSFMWNLKYSINKCIYQNRDRLKI